jgi:hypothetical protein
MPITYFIFQKKKNFSKQKKKEEKYARVAEPPHRGWPATLFGLAQGSATPRPAA